MNDTLRLRLRHGALEFEAEGPVEAVRQERDWWTDTHKSALTAPPEILKEPTHESKQTKDNDTAGEGGTTVETGGLAGLQQIFRRDDKGNLSLKAILPGENRAGEAALLLLCGYREILKADEIFAVRLMFSMRESGYTKLSRIDREMAKLHSAGFVNPFGEKRSRKYRLTNAGARRGQELATELAKLI